MLQRTGGFAVDHSEMLQILQDMHDHGLVTDDSYILCVNDGSSDNTWKLLKQIHAENKKYEPFR